MAKGNPKYNVYLGLNFDEFTKGASEAKRVGKSIDRMLGQMAKATNNVTIGEKKLARMRRDGKISAKQYSDALARLRMVKVRDDEKTRKSILATDKMAQSHLAAEKATDRHIRSLQRLEQQKRMTNLGRVAIIRNVDTG